MTTLLICAGETKVRETLAQRASAIPGLSRVDTAACGSETLARYPVQRPDLVLVDAGLPGGAVQTVRQLLLADPQAVVYLLGRPDDDSAVAAAVTAGTRGWLERDLTRHEIALLVAQSPSSQSPSSQSPSSAGSPPRGLSPSGPAALEMAGSRAGTGRGQGAGHLRGRVARPAPPGTGPRPHRAQLTERELQVLRGMCEGKSNGQIGRELFLSEDTVKTHARRLFRKLGVSDRAHAVASGFRQGLVS